MTHFKLNSCAFLIRPSSLKFEYKFFVLLERKKHTGITTKTVTKMHNFKELY